MGSTAKRKPFVFEASLRGYPCPVLVAVGVDDATLRRALTKRGCEEKCLSRLDTIDDEETTGGHSTLLPCGRSVLWLKVADLTPRNTASIAHESFHVVVAAFRKIGIRLTDASEEAYAYAIGGLVAQVVEGISERKRR